MEIKAGTTVIDGKKIVNMFENQETRNVTINFEGGNSLLLKQHESIAKVLNHRWNEEVQANERI